MKLRTNEGLVISSSQEKTQFKAKASPKMFNILCNTLYKDKVAAVIREIMANAYDSHVAAGKTDIPFHVNLPSDFSPMLEIEDFGIGMSRNDVEEIYTTLFESTKTESDDFIGAMGLGSKTPLAYTRQFTVTSRHNGLESTYSIYFDTDGIPVCSHILSIPTQESNGVKISVPVSPEDFSSFRDRFEHYSSFYPVKPTCNENVNYGDDWVKITDSLCLKSKTSWGQGAIYFVMGNVPYKVDFGDLDVSGEYREVLRTVLEKNHIMVVFDIGDLDVSASRESLSFDDETKLKAQEKIDIFVDNYRKKIQEKISQFSTIHQVSEFIIENPEFYMADMTVKVNFNAKKYDCNYVKQNKGKEKNHIKMKDLRHYKKVSGITKFTSLYGRRMSSFPNTVKSTQKVLVVCQLKGSVSYIKGRISMAQNNGFNEYTDIISCKFKYSETLKKRIKKVYGDNFDITVISYDQFKELLKSYRNRVQSVRTPKTTLKCEYYSFDVSGSELKMKSAENICMDSITDDMAIFSTPIKTYEWVSEIHWCKNNIKEIFSLLGAEDKKELILIKNVSRLEKKFEKFGIKLISDVLYEKLMHNQEMVKKYFNYLIKRQDDDAIRLMKLEPISNFLIDIGKTSNDFDVYFKIISDVNDMSVDSISRNLFNLSPVFADTCRKYFKNFFVYYIDKIVESIETTYGFCSADYRNKWDMRIEFDMYIKLIKHAQQTGFFDNVNTDNTSVECFEKGNEDDEKCENEEFICI